MYINVFIIDIWCVCVRERGRYSIPSNVPYDESALSLC